MIDTGRLAKIVGEAGVSTAADVLQDYKDDGSFVSGKMPECVVRPSNARQVQEIVGLANERHWPVVPVSSRGPHGRGDTVPEVGGALILDLSGMDKIMRMDKRNKVALVEPGVSFGTLQSMAARQGLRVAMPLAPRSGKSVVTSLLEREPTTLPKYHWDMSDPLCCLEVVFGTGDLFRTGAAAGPGTLEQQWASGQSQKSPMGPSQTDWAKIIQGAQGTMGIVTWASLKLERAPTVEKVFFVGAQEPAELTEFVYAILKARLPDYCMVFDRVAASCVLTQKAAGELPPWGLLYSISGYDLFPEDRVAYIEADIRDLARACGIRVSAGRGLSLGRKLLAAVSRPSGDPYWKELLCKGFQEIFFLTTLDRAPEFVRLMEFEGKRRGFPRHRLGVYLQPIHQGRACHVEFTLMYDPSKPDEAREAAGLCRDASRALAEAGAFFSRPYGFWAELAYARCPDTVAALRKVKTVLDPNGILNPGKLCFRDIPSESVLSENEGVRL